MVPIDDYGYSHSQKMVGVPVNMALIGSLTSQN